MGNPSKQCEKTSTKRHPKQFKSAQGGRSVRNKHKYTHAQRCLCLRIGNRTRVLHVFGSSRFYASFQSRGFMFFFGCRTRCSFCFICVLCFFPIQRLYVFLWMSHTLFFLFYNLYVICFALCFFFCFSFFLWSFCKHVCDRTQTRYMLCSVFLWSLLSLGFGGVGYFANMSVIEHKRVTCCALCFCGLSCHWVSGGWGILQTCL